VLCKVLICCTFSSQDVLQVRGGCVTAMTSIVPAKDLDQHSVVARALERNRVLPDRVHAATVRGLAGDIGCHDNTF